MSWGHIIIVLMMVVGIAGGVYIYRTPGARERGNRTLQELRARYSNFKGTVCDHGKKIWIQRLQFLKIVPESAS